MTDYSNKYTKKKENKMQETFTISGNAIKLNYVLSGISYTSNELSAVEKQEHENIIKTRSKFLYNESIKEVNDFTSCTLLAILNMSKLIQDDEMEIRIYEYLKSIFKDDAMMISLNKIISSNTNIFSFVDNAEILFELLRSMGVSNFKETYQELDLLQVDLSNKPIYVNNII